MSIRSTLLLALAAGLPALASAQGPVALLRVGDSVAPSGHTISSFSNVYANHAGGFGVGLNSSDGVETLSQYWGSPTPGAGTILRTESIISPFTQTAFESFWGMSDTGEIAYSPTCATEGETGLDTVWLDSTPLAVEFEPIASLPGQFFVFASRPTCSGNGIPFWISGYTSVQGGATQARGLFKGTSPVAVIKTGDAIGGISELVNANSAQFNFQVSALGTNWISGVQIAAASTTDYVVVINGTAALASGAPVREGTLVPVASGGNGTENWQAWDMLAINEAGDWLMTGDTNGATATDAFVAKNGIIVLREGQLVGGFPTTGGHDAADMNEEGDWAALWNVNDGAVREAIIYNGELVIKEGDPIDFDGDGTPDAGVTLIDIGGIDSLSMGDRNPDGSVDIYFTGETTNGDTFFRVTVGGTSCVGDFDGDGDADSDDIVGFFGAWDTGDLAADVDNDDDTDSDDIVAFFASWDAGC